MGRKKSTARRFADLEESTYVLLEHGLVELQLQLEVIRDRRESGEKQNQMATATAALINGIAKASTEIRQLDEARRKRIDQMTPDERDASVAEYLRGLPVERLHQFRLVVDEMTEEASVLG